MAQSHQASLTEALTNIVVGFALALAAQVALFPGFGIRVGFGDNLRIAVSFTFISLVRSYVLRRLFNAYDGRQS